jgi:hypothetical protein
MSSGTHLNKLPQEVERGQIISPCPTDCGLLILGQHSRRSRASHPIRKPFRLKNAARKGLVAGDSIWSLVGPCAMRSDEWEACLQERGHCLQEALTVSILSMAGVRRAMVALLVKVKTITFKSILPAFGYANIFYKFINRRSKAPHIDI